MDRVHGPLVPEHPEGKPVFAAPAFPEGSYDLSPSDICPFPGPNSVKAGIPAYNIIAVAYSYNISPAGVNMSRSLDDTDNPPIGN